jgi:hypothetical protein
LELVLGDEFGGEGGKSAGKETEEATAVSKGEGDFQMKAID